MDVNRTVISVTSFPQQEKHVFSATFLITGKPYHTVKPKLISIHTKLICDYLKTLFNQFIQI